MADRPGSPSDFDVIVVGAGAAGSVLAGRLSEAPSCRVLLVEAGPDAAPGREHPEIRDPFPTSVYNPRFSWPRFVAETGTAAQGSGSRASRPFLQGLGVGGSSIINGMNALRGQPADYDGWADAGAHGWSWDEVLPYFRKLERDLDFAGPLNGTEGPMPMRRVPPGQWAPFAAAMAQAMERRGFRMLSDYNADFGDGFASLPISSLPDRRISAATAYLTDEVRARPNLHIHVGTIVDRILFDGGRVCGIEGRNESRRRTFSAREVIVACGGILSPALLMRSGIGPAERLRRLGITPLADLPGVGQNLQNHPTLNVTSYLPLGSVQPLSHRAVAQNCLRYSSREPGCEAHDMGMVVFNRAAWHPLGRRIGSVGLSIYRPYSIGSVELASSDPRDLPITKFNTLDDPRDFARMVAGLKLLLELLTDPIVLAKRKEAFLPNPAIVARFGRRTQWNFLRTLFIALLLDSDALRRALLRDAVLDLETLKHDDQAIRDYASTRTSLAHHVCGTCRMGDPNDPMVVVDPRGRVSKVPGLRVADPSIFPTIPRGGMHIQAIMAAEKMADLVKQDLAGAR